MTIQKLNFHITATFFLALILTIPTLSFADAKMDETGIVKGKIGIEIVKKDKSDLAKKRNRITTDDKLKVYADPDFKSYTYVISSDKKTASLLSPSTKSKAEAKEGLKSFPGAKQYYQFDETSDVELLTIICSPNELNEVKTLFESENVSHKEWAELEKSLIKKSKVLASKDVGKEVQIGGFVQQGLRSAGSFTDKIPVRRGNSLLIKNYEFRVYNAKK
ncbi:MAG: hypothetical protein ACQ9MH_12820 [Nitrospinales bacterium]